MKPLYKQVVINGLLLAVLILLLKGLEIQFLVIDNKFEIYAGFLALIFTGLGIWLAIKLRQPEIQTVFIEKEVIAQPNASFKINLEEAEKINLSRRELEVLQLMAAGLSNQEIADKLFVSLNTIKTHVAQLFEKMHVKRRTQAIFMAKRLDLIP